jgi:hypothetical protein
MLAASAACVAFMATGRSACQGRCTLVHRPSRPSPRPAPGGGGRRLGG